ncbi:hypothetical protein A8C32_14310 [Flavivirga aquatica]|uniref:TonB-dependent receptor n=1 Tax=Flavivirga aquatica TaxID=1849968 RepID=A0A1E5TCH5_9FLAO|nr:carboxypeptidase-like regulatory domain-containing protein [Flavivirga aquatica]OEK09058.1 hypothetical protein A8C32_14310 [Flavivirga aquatica]
MLKIEPFIVILVLLSFRVVFSQSIEISGKVESNIGIENIHVINKTSQVFTITDSKGSFIITAKINDTLTFSSIQYKLKEVIISKDIILSKALFVKLEEQINELEEVVVGRVLTGSLSSDITNVEGKAPINFFDVGIPGYTGKPATQGERRLHEATTGGGIVPLNPILNAISGRTKMLKKRIQLEVNDELLQKIKASLSEDFFSMNSLDESLYIDFFYFCQEDPNFNKRCKGKNDIEILEFLKEKLITYKANLE